MKQLLFVSKANKIIQHKDFSHAPALLSRLTEDTDRLLWYRCRLIKSAFVFFGSTRKKSPRPLQAHQCREGWKEGGGGIIRPIWSDKNPWATYLSPFSSEQYCGSAHTSWEQTELPQDTVKKKEEHQYFIKLLSLSGPDQSLDSHSPTGREDSFVFAPQVEQQSGGVRSWKPCNALGPSISQLYCWGGGGGGGKKVKSRDREGENMFQRCPEIELLGLTVLCYFLLPPPPTLPLVGPEWNERWNQTAAVVICLWRK